MKERRLMCLLVPFDALLDILNGKVKIADLDLPDDVAVVDIRNDQERLMLRITVESAAFAPVQLGCVIPHLPLLNISWR
jgi:hypothetical protein